MKKKIKNTKKVEMIRAFYLVFAVLLVMGMASMLVIGNDFAVSEQTYNMITGLFDGASITGFVIGNFEGLQINEAPNFGNEVLSSNKNDRMDFNVDGNLRLYFDLLDVNKLDNGFGLDSVVPANEFSVDLDESGARDLGVDYKWGYNVRLNDLKFVSKVDVTSDNEIIELSGHELKIGENVLSFEDLINEGYTVSFGEPELNFAPVEVVEVIDPVVEEPVIEEEVSVEDSRSEEIVIPEVVVDPVVIDPVENIGGGGQNEEIIEEPVVEEEIVEEPVAEEPVVEEEIPGEEVVDEPEVVEELEIIEIPIIEEPIVEETIVESEVIEEVVEGVVEVEEIEEELKEEPEVVEEPEIIVIDEPSITGNVVAGITGFVVGGVENNLEVVDTRYDNTISVYIERDFAGSEFNVGDMLYLDPTLTTINITDVSVNTDLVNITAENNFTHLSISSVAPYVQGGYGLVAYWPFDINHSDDNLSHDFTKYNQHANAINVTWGNSTCPYGGCYAFNSGLTSNVTGVVSHTFRGQDSHTISLWVKVSSYPEMGIHADLVTQGSSDGLVIDEFGSLHIWDDVSDICSGPTVGLNKWTHVVITGNNTGMAYIDARYYIDGSVDTTCPGSGISWSGPINSIGAGFDGQMDEIMIFNHSLNPTEIADIYNNQSPRFNSRGIQGFGDQTVLNITTGHNSVVIKGDTKTYFNSSVNLTVGYYNGGWTYAPVQDFDGSNVFPISASSTNISLNFTFYAGNHSEVSAANSFYSPILQSDINNLYAYNNDTPNLTIISPLNNTRNSKVKLNINYTVSDIQGIEACWYSNDSYTVNKTLTDCSNITDVTWSQGPHNLTIYIRDASGLENSSRITFNVSHFVFMNVSDVSVDIDLSNVTAEPNFTHASISSVGPYVQGGYGLIAYLPFDLNHTDNNLTYDYTKYNEDATVANATWGNTSCIYDGCYTFNSDHNSNITEVIDYTFRNLDSHTISLWVKVTSYPGMGENAEFVTQGGNDGLVMDENGALHIWDDVSDVCAGPTMPLNIWQHIVITGNDTEMAYRDARYYINGSVDNVCNGDGISWSGAINRIGAGFDGQMDEIMIFNHSLNPTEIADIYNNQSPRFNTSGYQGFKNVSKFNFSEGYNTFEVLGDYREELNSSLNLSLDYFNGSWFSTAEQEFTGYNIFEVDRNSVNITVNFTFASGNYSEVSRPNPFYSPILTSVDKPLQSYGSDTIKPAINITYPFNNTEISDANADLNYTRSDILLDTCWYSNDTYSVNITLASCVNLTSIVWAEGQHNVTVWASDTSGNINSSKIVFTVSAASDSTKPNVTLLGPANNSLYSSLTINFAANYTDETALFNATPFVWNSTGNLINSTENESAIGFYNDSNISIILPRDDTYHWNYLVCDTSDNCAWNETNYTVRIDSTLLISFDSSTPVNGTKTSNSSVEFNVSITEGDLDEVKWNWNGTNYTIYNDSLVLMYNFDNVSSLGENDTHVLDLSGNGNNGTGILGPKVNDSSNCVFGQCFTFDGSNYISVADNDLWTFNDDFTLSIWVKYSGFNTDTWWTNALMGHDAGGGGNNKWIFSYGGNPNATLFHINVPANNGPTLTGNNWEAQVDTWYHLSVVRDGSSYTFYRNGVPDGTDSSAFSIPNAAAPLTMGYAEGASNYLKGNLEEPRIWDRALGADEVYQLYASNLRKVDSANWTLYVNQSLNATDGLPIGNYTYFASAEDNSGNFNMTNVTSLEVTAIPDTTAPEIAFSQIVIPNGTKTSNTTIEFNVSINESSLSEVIWNWNGTNYTIYNDSLVLMYNFDNVSMLGDIGTNVSDASNSNINGTCVGMGSNCNYTAGYYGNALGLEGKDDYLNLGSGLVLTEGISIGAWIRLSSNPPADGTIIAKRTSTDVAYLFRQSSTSSLQFGFKTGATGGWNQWTTDSSVLTNDVWHYVAVRYDESNDPKIFVDGIEKPASWTLGAVNNLGGSTEPVYVGFYNGGVSSAYFNGSIDELRVWDYALNETELYQQYASNFRKLDTANWTLWVNQSLNATDSLLTGGYNYSASAKDDAGNENITGLRTVTINQNPGISFTTGTEVNGTHIGRNNTLINVTVSDDNLLNVTIYLYNTTDLVNQSNDTASFYANYSQLPDGTYFFNATAYDEYGDKNSTETRNVTIDSSLPIIVWYAPTEDVWAENDTYHLNASITDLYLDVINLTVYNSSDDIVLTNYTNITDGSTTVWQYDILNSTTLGGDGNYYAEICAIDSLADSPDKPNYGVKNTGSVFENVMEFYDADTGNNISLTFQIHNPSDNPVSLNGREVNLTFELDGKHIVFGGTAKFNNVQETARLVYHSNTEVDLIAKSQKPGHFITSDYQLYYHHEQLIDKGWDILDNYTDENGDYVVEFDKQETGVLDFDPITGGLNTVCTNSSLIKFDTTNPLISFDDSTPANGTITSNASIEYNVSITELNLDEVIWNFNETNYTIYNDSLVLMMNFDNVSSLGEGGTNITIDLGNYSNNGTCFGTANSCNWTDGRFGNGIEFDGTDDYIQVDYDGELNLVKGFSVEAWIKPSDTGNYQGIITKNAGPGGADYQWLMAISSSDTFQLYDNTAWRDSGLSVSYDEWQHVIYVINDSGAQFKVIKDGVSGAWIANSAIPSKTNNIYIGAGWAGAFEYNGFIDEVRIWNRTLSDEEAYIEYVSNLRKLDSDSWGLYVNQSSTTGTLPGRDYNATAFVLDVLGKFNATDKRNISIPSSDPVNPNISYVDPTLANGSRTENTALEYNISITEENLNNIVWNFNETNYTMYNSSVVLMYNFDNVSAFGENRSLVVDMSGNGNNGTITGDLDEINSTGAGYYGSGLELDGTGDWINAGNDDGLNLISGFSFEAWIKPEDTGNYQMIIGKHNSPSAGGPYQWLISIDNADGFVIWDNAAWRDSGLNVDYGQWQHIVYEINTSGTEFRVIKNGINGSWVIISAIPSTSYNVWVGSGWSNTYRYNGLMDELRLYNEVLSLDQVTQNYMSNLRRLDSDSWTLYINQTLNSTDLLPLGDYNSTGFVYDNNGNFNATDKRNISIVSDVTAPEIGFSDVVILNGTQTSNTSVEFNVSINESSLSEVIWNWNGTNYTMYNDSLVLMYNFDNVSMLGEKYNSTEDWVVVDLSNHGNNGTAVANGTETNGPSLNSEGIYGQALDFDGKDDWINITENDSLNITTGITFGLWMRTNDSYDVTPTWGMQMLGRGTYGDPRNSMDIRIRSTGDTAIFGYEYGSGTNSDSAIGTTDIADGNWHHVLAQWNTTDCLVFVDGKVEGTASCPNTPGPFDEQWIIGKSLFSTQDYFNGTLDEVRIWNYSLNSSEVYQQYASNLRRYGSSNWSLYVNQSLNSTDGLGVGNYTYFASAEDNVGNLNMTNITSIEIQNYPGIAFSDVVIPNGTQTANTSIEFNVSINESKLNEVIWNWDGTNYTIYNDSLVLMFNFDNVSNLGENDTLVVDLSGYGNNGTVTGGFLANGSGRYGGSFSFDGASNNSVRVQNDRSLQFESDDFSISAWVYQNQLATTSGHWHFVIDKRVSGSNGVGFAVNTDNNKLVLRVDGTSYTVSSNTIPANEWVHLVFVRDVSEANEGIAYINGVLDFESNVGTANVSSNVDLVVGKRSFGANANQMDGLIDELMVYNGRALSSDEVYQLYASNLRKYDTDKWALYVNQSLNATDELPIGNYTYFASAENGFGNVNMTNITSLEITNPAAGNNAPTNPIISLNSTDHTNKTLTDLNCYANITDPDSDKMNVTVNWFENNTLNFSLDYNSSYASGSLFIATLDNSNTTKGKVWNCGMRLHDGSDPSDFVNSTSAVNITILNSPPLAILDGPIGGYQTTNRTPNFTFSGSDDDGDTLEFELNVSLVAASLCTDTERYITKGTIGTNTNHDLANYLQCLWDNLDNYTWTARAYDGEEYGEWNETLRYILINSDVTISLPVSEVNFGNLNNTHEDNTSDGDPVAMVLQNDGNALLNISVNFTDIWDSVELPNETFKYRVRNVSDDCFNLPESATSWVNAPNDTAPAVHQLNFTGGYQAACRNVSIDLAVRVPNDEPSGNKSSLVTFTSYLGETY